MRIPIAIAGMLVVTSGTAARAQVAFPADAAYHALRCGNAPMTDLFADDPAALEERDVVGTDAAPAGLRASDATNLYLRMRLEEDPSPGGVAAKFSWGMEFDLDDDPSTYELLVLVDGTGNAAAVNVFANTAATLANDPADPADAPAAATFPFAMNARSVVAPGTADGGSPDFFLDFAVPWSALAPLGLDRATPIHVWAGSSNTANSLNGDLACHDRSTGAPTLTVTASDPTTGDPAMDPNDGGGGGGGVGKLQGTEGCASGGTPSVWIGLALLGLVRRRRRAIDAASWDGGA